VSLVSTVIFEVVEVSVVRASRLGRRERNMQDKRARIFRAAGELFRERGFGAVTTLEISERADVAAGTLFRYAASKSELLLMVYNDEFRAALERGIVRARSSADPAEAVFCLVAPVLERARDHVENSAAYQRELLFGDSAERYRAEGLAQVEQLEAATASLLTGTGELEAAGARLVGVSVFAALHLTISRMSTGAHSGRDEVDDLRRQVAQIVAGYIALMGRATDNHNENGREN
jgi:AcrR family transcriptional regulator